MDKSEIVTSSCIAGKWICTKVERIWLNMAFGRAPSTGPRPAMPSFGILSKP